MARLVGPHEGARAVYVLAGSTFRSAAGLTATIYVDEGGSTPADLLTVGGAAIPGALVTVDTTSRLPQFQYPDGSTVVYASINGGPVIALAADPELTAGGTIAGPLAVNNTEADENPPLGIAATGGRGAQATGINILSSFAGGEDEGQVGQFDSTGRLNLYSYQRADFGSYGENIRRFLMRANAKSMDAWYAARENGAMTHGYDVNGDPDADAKWVPIAWCGAHWEANDGGEPHGHWSVEVPDTTGAIQTRFEIPFTDQDFEPAANRPFGVDITNIRTNLADLTVRATNGQVLRIGASNAYSKDILLSVSSDRDTAGRRWAIRANTDTENAGTNQGTNFELIAYGDSGNQINVPIHIRRSNGNVGIGTTNPGSAARVTAAWSTSGTHGFYATPTADAGSGAAFAFAAVTSVTTERFLNTKLTSDANARMVVYADGKHEWGDGTSGRDTTLYRSAADVLKTDDSFVSSTRLAVGTGTIQTPTVYAENVGDRNALQVKATAAGTATLAVLAVETPDTTKRAIDFRVTGDAVSRLRIDASASGGPGTLVFGDGASADTNLYRSAVDTLKTDDSFHVGATLRHLGSSLGFYNSAAVTKPSATGSRGGNAALASLLTALASLGLVTDSTTA